MQSDLYRERNVWWKFLMDRLQENHF